MKPPTPPMHSVGSSSVSKHLGHLDALRGIAILGVILVHSSMLIQLGGTSATYAFTGQRGVSLFYMVSAFTLFMSLDAERPQKYPLSNYFLRRFFRIAPLFYAMILLNLILRLGPAGLTPQQGLGGVDILLGFLFLNGLRPHAINTVVAGGWSIAVETTFYLLLPLLIRYFTTMRRTMLLLIVSAPVLGFISTWLAGRATNLDDEQFFAFMWFPVEFPVFVLGMLTYCIWKEHVKGHEDGSRRQKDVSLQLLLCSAVIYLACLPFNDRGLYLSSFLFLPLILALSIHAWPLFVNPLLIFIGRLSYSLYLVHVLLVNLLMFAMDPIDRRTGYFIAKHVMHRHLIFPLVFIGLLGFSIPLSLLTWRYIEQPGIRLGRRIIAWREKGFIDTRKDSDLIPPMELVRAAGTTPDAQF